MHRHIRRGAFFVLIAVLASLGRVAVAQVESTEQVGDPSTAGDSNSANEGAIPGVAEKAGAVEGAESEEKVEASEEKPEALFTNDAVVLGLLMAILGFVFVTASSENRFFKIFYRIFPSLLMCYALPAVLTAFGIIDPKKSNLYFVASRYLLPTSLVLLTLSLDLRSVLRLGPKAVIMFLTGTVGIVIGGPIALFVVGMFSPETVESFGAEGESVWQGMTTLAGSWIGGGANQAAMKEVFGAGDAIFGGFLAVDILVANIWMAGLLWIAANSNALDSWLGADTRAIEELKQKVQQDEKDHSRIPSLADTMAILALGFLVTAVSHAVADVVAPKLKSIADEFAQANPGEVHWLAKLSFTSGFFWLIVTATTIGVFLSFTKARRYERAGASRIGSVFIYVLVASIGMKIQIQNAGEYVGLFAIGGIWMLVHVLLLLIVAYVIKSPMFFLAVGSKANVGGAASAPIVASAFHPALANVGVLLAVLGYVLGTYAAWMCGQLMRMMMEVDVNSFPLEP